MLAICLSVMPFGLTGYAVWESLRRRGFEVDRSAILAVGLLLTLAAARCRPGGWPVLLPALQLTALAACVVAVRRREQMRRMIALAGTLSIVQLTGSWGCYAAALTLAAAMSSPRQQRTPLQRLGFFILLTCLPAATALLLRDGPAWLTDWPQAQAADLLFAGALLLVLLLGSAQCIAALGVVLVALCVSLSLCLRR